MARRKKGLELEEDEPTVDISSLIDVVFLLLIYFIVTSKIAEPESDLILSLPAGESSAPSEVDPMFFLVAANGQIQQVMGDASTASLDGAGSSNFRHRTPEEMPQLESEVRTYAATSGKEGIVKIKVEPTAKAQYVVDLLNILSKHRITQITFTAYAD